MKEYVFLLRGESGVARLKVQGTFVVLGRTSPVPVLRADRTISREHAVLAATAAGIRLKDLGSPNGILVAGKRLAAYAEVDLAPGVRVEFGSTQLVLMTEREASKRLDQPVDEVVVAPDGSTQVVRAQQGAEPLAEPEPELEEADGLETQEGPVDEDPGDETEDALEEDEEALEVDAPDDWVEEALEEGEATSVPHPGKLTELDAEVTELEVRGEEPQFAELELPAEDEDPVEAELSGEPGISRVALTEIELENVLERGGEVTHRHDPKWEDVERELADLERREPNLE